jgi:glutaredoxin
MKPALLAGVAFALFGLAIPDAHALFKVVAPDGSVTYTDRPPQSGDGRVQPVNPDTGRSTDLQLPYALRQIASRFPVTLFTATDCSEACNMARSFLSRRGVPYHERTATSNEERDAWIRIVGGAEAPTLQVGGQSLRGFQPNVWDETLDVAGYPRTSQLPANYQATTAPLIAPRAPVQKPTAPVAAPQADTGSNPSGIRF